MKTAINIGASQSAVKEARAAINDILNVKHVDNSTKVEALKVLSSLCGVNNTQISGCHFSLEEQSWLH